MPHHTCSLHDPSRLPSQPQLARTCNGAISGQAGEQEGQQVQPVANERILHPRRIQHLHQERQEACADNC